MIGFHIQNSPQNWPEAVAKLPDNTPVKFVMGFERAIEAKAANPKCATWIRHHEAQPAPTGDYDNVARGIFQRFVNPQASFWPHVDYVQHWNEFYANSQGAAEKQHWIELDKSCAKIWQNEYRNKYQALAHVRLILAEAAVGNDIPLEVAQAAMLYDALLGYHSYIVVRNGEISPHDWRYYSGRWSYMDAIFRANGVKPDWIFGEMGAVRDSSDNWSGHLDPQGGWRHPECLNADINRYVDVLKYWLDNATKTAVYREGRVYGGVIFTSGGPGTLWKWFELQQPYMNTVADFVRNYPYPDKETPMSWQSELWNESVKRQTISLNPGAALQSKILPVGENFFTPVQAEFWYTPSDGIQRAAQAAENVATGERRVYYAVVPQWNNVQWFGEPTGLQAGDTVIDLSHHQAKLKPDG